MSRLIDADKLIKQLDDDIKITSEFVKKSIKYDDYHDFDKSFAVLYMLKSYRAIVEDMPTAFDVDKVVSELEDKYGCDSCDFNEEECIHDKHCVIYEILDIVKAGGIDE